MALQTISVNGGPHVPVEQVKQVLRAVRAGVRAAKGGEDPAAASRARQEAAAEAESAQWGNISAERLRSLVERIERLEEERKTLGSDIKDIFAEAKSAGFDVKVMRQLIRLRKQEPAEVEEQETLLDVYRRALGM